MAFCLDGFYEAESVSLCVAYDFDVHFLVHETDLDCLDDDNPLMVFLSCQETVSNLMVFATQRDCRPFDPSMSIPQDGYKPMDPEFKRAWNKSTDTQKRNFIASFKRRYSQGSEALLTNDLTNWKSTSTNSASRSANFMQQSNGPLTHDNISAFLAQSQIS